MMLSQSQLDICQNEFLYELFTERASIKEFDAGMSRHDAEQAAWDEVSAMILKVRNDKK